MITQMSARVRGTVLGLNATANQMGTATGSAIGKVVLTMGAYPHLAIVSVIAGLLSALAMRAVVQLPEEEPGTAPQVSAR